MSRGKGTPHPGEWIRHQQVGAPSVAADRTLYDGVTITGTTELTAIFQCAGASRIRARFKASQAGTLALYFLRTDGVTKYAAGNPSTVAVTSGTETLIDTNAAYGESWVMIGFTPAAGSGAVTLFDFMAL
jgi:hypothetical protein